MTVVSFYWTTKELSMSYTPSLLLMVAAVAVLIEVWSAFNVYRLPDTASTHEAWAQDRSKMIYFFLATGVSAPVCAAIALGYLAHEGAHTPLILLAGTIMILSTLGTIFMGRKLAVMCVMVVRDNVHNLDRVKSVTPA
jgi:hypothetical protein